MVFGEKEDFFTAKGVVEGILSNFCVGSNVSYVPSQKKCLHPTRGADVIVNGVEIGYFGQIHPSIVEKLDSDKPIYAGEIELSTLKKYYNDNIVFKNISKFPTVERDIAVLVSTDVACADIISVIKERAGKYLESVSLFDIYQGAQVGEGKKSMAFNLKFVADDRTLNVEEIDNAIKKVLKALNEKLGAELR